MSTPSPSSGVLVLVTVADGLATDMTEVRKLRMITQVEVMYKLGKIGDRVSCPICDVSMNGGHVRRKH